MVLRLTKAEFRQIIMWAYSLRGSCNRLHTATTLWTAEPEHRLLAAGYNGAPSGLPSCDEVGHLIVEGHCVRTNHGEENALLNCRDFDRLKGGIATVFGTPCYPCARKLVSAGVRTVEYIGSYHNAHGGDHIEDLFLQARCELRNIDIHELVCTLGKSIMFSQQSPGGMLKQFSDMRLSGIMNTMTNQAKIIIFEGGEGTGKGTQIDRLKLYLTGKYGADNVIATHEPGGGIPDYRDKIFDLKKAHPDASPEEIAKMEFDFFIGDRAVHVKNLLKPKKDAGCIVLCDRFTPSTVAYQGYGRGMSLGEVARANEKALDGLQPDLYILFDLDPKIGLERKYKYQPEKLNRFELEGYDFHNRVHHGYLKQVAVDSDRWVVVDASQDIDIITQQLILVLHDRLGL